MLFHRHRTFSARGIMNRATGRPFYIPVSTFSDRWICLPKHIIIPQCGTPPHDIHADDFSDQKHSPKGQPRYITIVKFFCWSLFKSLCSTFQSYWKQTIANFAQQCNTKPRLLAYSARLARQSSPLRRVFCIPRRGNLCADKDKFDLGWRPWRHQRSQTSFQTWRREDTAWSLGCIPCLNKEQRVWDNRNWIEFVPKAKITHTDGMSSIKYLWRE